MGFLQRAQRASFAGAVRASTPGPADAGWYTSDPSGLWRPGGIHVSAERALTLSALFQGMRLIGEGLGGMPCQLFRRKGDDGRDRVRGPGLSNVLRWQPNHFQTAFEFWQGVAAARVLRGIHVAEIKPGPITGYADTLVPIHPDLVTPARLPNGRLTYTVRGDRTGPRTLHQDEVFVVRGFTEPDGVTPMSVIRYGARSIGASIAAQDMGRSFFHNGVTPSIAVIAEDELGPEGIANLHASVMTYVSGRQNQFGVLPLEGGVKLEKLGLTPADAQLTMMLNFGVEDIARWLNIPLHMLRYGQQGTGSYASLEVFSAEFVTYTLRPHAIAIEQCIQRDLILEAQKDDVFAEFNMDALLRGDLKSRYEAYRIGIMSGFLRRNEARLKENLDPAEGLDEFWTPMNMTSTDNSVGGSGDKGGRLAKVLAFDASLRAGREGYRMVCLAREVAERLVRKELAAVERLGREQAKDAPTWKAELQRFYTGLVPEIAEKLQVTHERARAYAEAHGQALMAEGLKATESWDISATEELAVLALTGGDRVEAA